MRAFEISDGRDPRARDVAPFESEYELESRLDELPSLLLDEKLLVVGRQVGVETGTLDLLALDRYGNVVVFEVKKGESGTGSASEGSILSQPQQYARAVRWFSYDDLEEVYDEYAAELAAGEWRVGARPTDATLREAFRDRFGRGIDPEAVNRHQRMVVVAEEVTDQTAANARYLRDEGLNMQCVEVRRFRSGEDSSLLVSSTVVDYDERRVRPTEDGNPTYPEVARAIVDEASSTLEAVTGTSDPGELYLSGLDAREPRLRSPRSDHPDPIRYALRLKPLSDGQVRISIDTTTRGLAVDDVDKGELTGLVRSEPSAYEDAGFEVDHSRNTFRIVSDTWYVDTVAEMKDDAFVEEVADRYAELDRIGHEVGTGERR